MKQKKKSLFSILFSLALMLGMIQAVGSSIPAYASGPDTAESWSTDQSIT